MTGEASNEHKNTQQHRISTITTGLRTLAALYTGEGAIPFLRDPTAEAESWQHNTRQALALSLKSPFTPAAALSAVKKTVAKTQTVYSVFGASDKFETDYFEGRLSNSWKTGLRLSQRTTCVTQKLSWGRSTLPAYSGKKFNMCVSYATFSHLDG